MTFRERLALLIAPSLKPAEPEPVTVTVKVANDLLAEQIRVNCRQARRGELRSAVIDPAGRDLARP